MEELRDILKTYWGFESYLPLQREAIQCVLERRDSLVVLPTGGGKSLCFQAPAVASPGMAVVVSPLISLMKDQVDALRANGVPAGHINSAMAQSEREAVHRDVRSGKLKLLYVSPERIVQPNFVAYLRDTTVSSLVVDEAHCISHWGHDFRPEYRELRYLREALPDVAVHAYTATATEQVREDIIRELRLREPVVLVGSFDRPNLIFRVRRRDEGFRQIRQVIDEHPGESGLVYCIRRADVDALGDYLIRAGYQALPYHAGMDDAARKRNQEAFTHEDADILVATVAFGMGIDKSNVRYVIHAGMPKSIEHYHQESGRAGRDGLEADCWLFYSYHDFRVWESLIQKTESEGTAIALAKLGDMLRYCKRTLCRHKALVAYFGETYPDRPCRACDVCLGQRDAFEESGPISRTILTGVAELGSLAGPTYTTLVLTGSKEDRVVAKGHHHLGTYGALASWEPRVVRDWIEQLVDLGYLEKTGEYNVLALTRRGDAAREGRDAPQLAKPAERRPKKPRSRRYSLEATDEGPGSIEPPRTARVTERPPSGQAVDPGLFEALRRLRRNKAEELGVPPFVVFSDATLRDMARRRPRDRPSFLAVHGVGQRKCEAFGEEFLTVIRDYGTAHPEAKAAGPDETPGSEEAASPVFTSRSRADRDGSQRRADELFAQGRSVEEAAEALGRRPSTVEGYLVQYIRKHRITDASLWVDPAVVQRVAEAAAATGVERLKPIYEFLNGEVSYAAIRICLACVRNGAS